MHRTIAIALELNLPFHWHYGIYEGVQRFAEANPKWNCVIDEFPQYRMNRAGKQQPYDGIIARLSRSLANSANRHGIPAVNVWRGSPVKNNPFVNIDYETCGRLCAEHLLERGFRRFGFMTREEHKPDIEEEAEFRTCVEQAGYECSTIMVDNGDLVDAKTWGRLQDKTLAWLKTFEPPTGIFVPQGNLSRHIVHLCNYIGLSVPMDVSIVCGEDEAVFCESPSPSLTSISRNFENVGFEAACLLDQLIEGKRPASTSIRLPPRGIMPRNSTDFYAVDDELLGNALRYINANLHKPLDVEHIASAVATSPRTLQRRFRRCIDRSVAAEVRRLRIQLAKRKLMDQNIAVGEIARDAGFGSVNRMHEVFVREVGDSPTAYRKRLQS